MMLTFLLIGGCLGIRFGVEAAGPGLFMAVLFAALWLKQVLARRRMLASLSRYFGEALTWERL